MLWREVATAAELQQACEQEFPSCDVLLMAAAVADFRPSAPAEGKLKKAGREHLELELEPTRGRARGLWRSAVAPGQTLVGFAAEHGAHAIEAGRCKLAGKGLDAVVVNDISRPDIGFDADENEVAILTADGAWVAARATRIQDASRRGDPRCRRGSALRPRRSRDRERRAMHRRMMRARADAILDRAAFVPVHRAPAAVSGVGARPLFLRQDPVG